jgi:hypothetical protein
LAADTRRIDSLSVIMRVTHEADQIEISVVVAPHGKIEIADDIRMVKAALLYADHVTLVSPTSAMVALLGGLASMSDEDRRAVAAGLVARQMGEEGAAQLQGLRRKKNKSVRELLFLREFDEKVKTMANELGDRATEQVVDAGGNELAYAINQSLLDVDTLGIEDGLGTVEVVHRYTDFLITSVGPGSHMLPLMDDSSGALLASFERDKGLLPRPGRQAEEAGLAGYMIETIEAFPDATMSEIIDARRALAGPLVGFRSAIASMARDLETTPWNEGFEPEARALYTRDVAPQLQELRDIAEQTGVRSTLSHHLKRGSGRTGLLGGLGVAVSFGAAMPELGLVGAPFTALTTAADVASQIYRERRDLAAKKDANKMLLLFEVERRLSNNREPHGGRN